MDKSSIKRVAFIALTIVIYIILKLYIFDNPQLKDDPIPNIAVDMLASKD